jgi:hypothetical protein
MESDGIGRAKSFDRVLILLDENASLTKRKNRTIIDDNKLRDVFESGKF